MPVWARFGQVCHGVKSNCCFQVLGGHSNILLGSGDQFAVEERFIHFFREFAFHVDAFLVHMWRADYIFWVLRVIVFGATFLRVVLAGLKGGVRDVNSHVFVKIVDVMCFRCVKLPVPFFCFSTIGGIGLNW